MENAEILNTITMRVVIECRYHGELVNTVPIRIIWPELAEITAGDSKQ